LTEEIKARSQFVEQIMTEAGKVIVGQKGLLERLAHGCSAMRHA